MSEHLEVWAIWLIVILFIGFCTFFVSCSVPFA